MQHKAIALAVLSTTPFANVDRSILMMQEPERIHALWAPIENILDQMEQTGYTDCVRGVAVTQVRGHWYEFVPALTTVIAYHELAGVMHLKAIDLEPLRKLSARLDAGAPIFEGDMRSIRQSIAACKQQIAGLTVAQAKNLLRTVEIKVAMERILRA